MQPTQLILDFGNTYLKYALFNKRTCLSLARVETHNAAQTVHKLLNTHKCITRAIVSSVQEQVPMAVLQALQTTKTIHLTHHLKLPFTIGYKTPDTLGVDRLALVAAATLHYPKSNVLVIDAGTCITYDLLSANNIFLGGVISPGIHMRYKALHNQTGKLPQLQMELPTYSFGTTTKEAMHLGVIQATVFEIEAYIARYSDGFEDLKVILTGGDTNFLLEKLKNDIFAHSNFLMEGLNYILELNSN